MRQFLLRLSALCLSTPVVAAPTLLMPVDCVLGDTCFIQNYVDADPTGGAVDFTCGPLSYDNHKGTDFALPSTAAMEAGTDVLAAAPGVVRGVRDGMQDRVYEPSHAAEIAGRDCGNGAVIDHGDGWETQYCHMRAGSVTVTPGQRVEAGTVLGQVGLSGRTQFPHLHLSVRHAGAVVDPFRPDAAPGQCGTRGGDPLWSDPPAYRAGGLIAAGFAPAVPDYDAVKAGTAHRADLPASTPAIVVWVYGFGSRAGDRLDMRITGADGPVFEGQATLEKAQAQYFRAAGKRIRTVLPPGDYTGTIVLVRDGRAFDRIETRVTIR